ncbi:hypothetical protein AB0L40_21295, partial [Patulibacter sp. NPDC049589]|uniref:hypothetical protein n=1 Tax=Patulibacter sp. NPDC049589 TaxID=3154731 RepID=UPI003425A00D
AFWAVCGLLVLWLVVLKGADTDLVASLKTALTGHGAVGLGPDARSAVVVLLALVGTVAVALRPDDPPARIAGVAAGLLLALLVGEGTGLVQLTLSGGIGPPFLSPTRDGVVAAVLVASAAIAAVLLVVAVRRRDVVLGVLPAGVLLLVHPVDGAVVEAGVLLVPVVLVAAAGAAAAGVGPAPRLVPRPAAPAALAVTVVVLLVGVAGAFGVTSQFLDTHEYGSGVQGGFLAVAIACTAGVLLTAALALRTEGTAGAAAALATIVALHLLHPLVLFRPAAPDSFVAHAPLAIVLPLLELALGLAVARRHATAPVLAATGLFVVSALQAVAFGIATVDDDVSGELVVAVTLGPAVLAIAGGAVHALTGPARNVLRAQAFSAGAAVGALLFAGFATSGFALVADGDGATLKGGQAVLALALVVVAAFGVALLAASTARRASVAVATAAIGVTATLAMVIASIAAAVADHPANDEVRAIGTPAIQSALGFDDAGSVLAGAGAAWPVFLAVLGVVLLGTGAWLESQRPLPPDAPLG